ncbi:MAG: NYN domain-containing protein [Burkholderiaceae bacterium]
MLTTIVVDGPFFVKRIRQIFPIAIHYDPRVMADLVWRLSAAHLFERNQPKRHLFRIFFYDMSVQEKRVVLPVTRQSVDLSRTKEGLFRQAFHRQLHRKRKLSLRLGEGGEMTGWQLREDALNDLIAKRMETDELHDDDFTPNVNLRGMALRMGVDIVSLAYKRQVQQIVLLAGDGYFAPAAELARHEGVDIVLDPMWQNIPEDLFAFIDGLRSTCPPAERAGEFLSRAPNDSSELAEEDLPAG